MDKENNVRGVRKAKAAPDFSKLHRQWDAKLQKGKAVSKKPLTQVQPFPLSQNLPSKSSSSSGSDDEFISDALAKENILNGNGFHEIQTNKPHRATISGIPRSSQIKSSIPRSSLIATKRNSLYSKDNKNRGTIPTVKISTTPLTVKKQLQSRSVVKKENNNTLSSTAIGNFTCVPTNTNLQGFEVDFKPDADALDSILNGKGIERLPKSPPQVNDTTLGPVKTVRTKGRVVPFSRPSAAARLNGNGRMIQAENSTANMNTAKQRWSIYSRDSYSTKPDLMDWLQKMIDDSKAKRATGKQHLSTSIPSAATIAENHLPGNNIKDSSNITRTESIPEPSNLSRTMPAPVATAASKKMGSKVENLFSKTLIGYQGFEEPKLMTTKAPATLNFLTNDENKNRSNDTSNNLINKKSTGSTASEETYTTPVKRTGPLPTYAKGSSIKSILKTKPAVDVKTPKTQDKSDMNKKKSTVCSPVTPAQQAMKLAGTPVRLSTYARQQQQMGLPLPKENRYERFGEKITGPSFEGMAINSPKSPAAMKINPEISTIGKRKAVHWADHLETSFTGIKESIRDDQMNELQSPEVSFHAAVSSHAQSEGVKYISVNNHKNTPFAFKRTTSPPPSFSKSFSSNSKTVSPSSHAHTIKYVMPAEQPLEKEERRHHQINKSLFQTSEESKVDLLQINCQQELAKPLVPVKAPGKVLENKSVSAVKNTKSWAQVLGEELDVLTTSTKPVQLDKKQTEQSSVSLRTFPADTIKCIQEEQAESSSYAQKKLKKRINKRISILEEIYGDAIQYRDASPDQQHQPTTAVKWTGAFSSVNPNHSLGLGIRPLPTLDEKLVGDLMSFQQNESDDELLDEHSYFEGIKEEEIGDTTSVVTQPCQSTMLDTPSSVVNLPSQHADEILMEITPVLGDAVIELACTKLPEAPCKRLTKARTPYKQEMLDILERTLTAARQREKNNDEALNCTIKANTSTTTGAESEPNSDNKSSCKGDFPSNIVVENAEEKRLLSLHTEIPNLNNTQHVIAEREDRYESVVPIVRPTNRSLDQAPHFTGTTTVFDDSSYANKRLLDQQSHGPFKQHIGITSETNKNQNTSLSMSTKLQEQKIETPVSNATRQKDDDVVMNISRTKQLPNICSPSMRMFSTNVDNVSKQSDDNAIGLFSGKPRLNIRSGITSQTNNPSFHTMLTSTANTQSIPVDNIDTHVASTSTSFPTANSFGYVHDNKKGTTVSERTPLAEAPVNGSILFNNPTVNTSSFFNIGNKWNPLNNNATTFSSKSSTAAVESYPTVNATAKTMFEGVTMEPNRSANLFSAPPLFSSLSHNMKFSSSSDTGLDKPDIDITTTMLKPSQFMHLNGGGSKPSTTGTFEYTSKVEDTLNESSMLDESDMCLVFKREQPQNPTGVDNEEPESTNPVQPVKHTEKTKPLLTIQQQQHLRSESPKFKGSAFHCVLRNQDGDVNNSQSLQRSVETIKNSYNKLCVKDLCKNSNVLCVDTEVAMYTKIWEIRKHRNDDETPRDAMNLRDGALNIVSTLLTHGDSKHFVPISL